MSQIVFLVLSYIPGTGPHTNVRLTRDWIALLNAHLRRRGLSGYDQHVKRNPAVCRTQIECGLALLDALEAYDRTGSYEDGEAVLYEHLPPLSSGALLAAERRGT